MTELQKAKLRIKQLEAEVKKLSPNLPVIESVCVHKWKYLSGSPQNELHQCLKCGATG
jgi:hypothetical protein